MEKIDFDDARMAIAKDIMIKHPFATLVLSCDQQPKVWHLPVSYQPQQQLLLGHISGQNPLLSAIDLNQPVPCTLIFMAEHGYVSPTWHQQITVPTWDYCTIHVSAELQLESEEMKVSNMEQQIAAVESDWRLNQLNPTQQRQMLGVIKILKFKIKAIHGHFKMSQNKPKAVKQAMIEQFELKGQQGLIKRYAQMWG